MKYERKMCEFCKSVTLHRVDEQSGEDVCLRCNNSDKKVKLGFKK